MQRHVIAIALGSFIALPAFANYEINAGERMPVEISMKSRAEVRAEVEQAFRSGELFVNGELGTPAGHL